VLANWLLMVFGLIDLGPLTVPAGTFAAGLVFGLRDLVQRDLGARWALVAIVVGALLSALLSPALALASGVAFLVAELLDWAVYQRLLRRGWTAAVVGSNVVGSVVDTGLFLLLAGFWSWPALLGAVVVKWLATLPVLGLARVWR
jgi:uncharacterized PurR-regulated membrane protein YhhQ (DUF165 family)